MEKKTPAVPEGFNTVSAYLVVRDVREALDFYERALGAERGLIMAGPDGESVLHAEMRLGNSTLMLTQENPIWNQKSPLTLGGCGLSLHLYVDDCDRLYQQAVQAGCEVVYPLQDAFWGDRYGKVRDPFGHEWGIATHQEDLEPAELAQRQEEYFRSLE